jgi:zinc and cadmium transporter
MFSVRRWLPAAIVLLSLSLAAGPASEAVAVQAPVPSPAQTVVAVQNSPAQTHDHASGHDHSHADPHDHPPAAEAPQPYGLLAMYCVAILGASLLGGWLPSLIDLTHNRLQLMISFVGGLMLGIGLFHMLPHAIVQLGGAGATDRAMWWMTLGVLTMFGMLRAFHFHHHSPVDMEEFRHAQGHEGCGHEHDHDHSHDHSHDVPSGQGHGGGHGHHHHHSPGRDLSWVGVFLGLGMHTFLDGMAVAASVEADRAHGMTTGLLGLGTFLAVLLHKPLDAVSITWLMSTTGWPRWSRILVNAAFAAMCPLGVALFLFGAHRYSGQQATFIGCSLAFAAGLFVCISLSDLLPEIEFHRHHRVRLSLALLAGVALAYGIGYLEPAHTHGGDAARAGHAHDHGHAH